ncbi:hypothetical protein LINPERPRIM_LOCUS19847, partial [Linum perenne]
RKTDIHTLYIQHNHYRNFDLTENITRYFSESSQSSWIHIAIFRKRRRFDPNTKEQNKSNPN